MNYYPDIDNAIRTMHYEYGIGDIQEIRYFADGAIEITSKGYGMKPHIRKGSIVKIGYRNRIRLYGHQLTVTIVKEKES
jgi:hypothetical protein